MSSGGATSTHSTCPASTSACSSATLSW